MPTYNFKDTKTGQEFEECFTMNRKDMFLKQNPDIVQLPSLFSMSASGTGDRIKTDDGWKENLSRIAEAHPNTPLGHKYSKKTIKEQKTRQVLKKHGVL